MQKRIAVITVDRFLFQKIFLSLRDASVKMISVSEASEEELLGFDVCIWDIDQAPMPEYCDSRFISLGRDGALLSRPFSRESILALLSSEGESKMRLGERRAYLHGEEIKLTELEFALLKRLVRAGGEFVSREELLKSVWGEDADGGILNVYVHYLREKLEKHGEKIIFSSRKYGYKIDEKYLKGR